MSSEPGHNGQLKSIVERIENIEEQIKEFGKDRAEVYLEAKGNGFDVKVLRMIIRMRKESPDDRAAREAILDIYKHALGMLT